MLARWSTRSGLARLPGPSVPPKGRALFAIRRHRLFGFGRPVDGIRLTATLLGVGVGVSGIEHGFFETLQGNVATPGLFVQALGPAQRMWLYGTEDAFTLVPNFLISGLLSMFLGMLVVGWSVGFLHRPSGARGLLLLGLAMVLAGGGVAALAFLFFAWWTARRIGRPIELARRLRPTAANALARTWPIFLGIAIVLFAIALEVAIVGWVPGVSDPRVVELADWGALLAMLVAFVVSILGASAAAWRDAASTGPTPDSRSIRAIG